MDLATTFFCHTCRPTCKKKKKKNMVPNPPSLLLLICGGADQTPARTRLAVLFLWLGLGWVRIKFCGFCCCCCFVLFLVFVWVFLFVWLVCLFCFFFVFFCLFFLGSGVVFFLAHRQEFCFSNFLISNGGSPGYSIPFLPILFKHSVA